MTIDPISVPNSALATAGGACNEDLRLFKTFWMAGFESACHINRHKERLDMIASTGHEAQCSADYALLRELGFETVREGIRWHRVDKGAGQYDFSSFLPMLKASLDSKMQVIWNLCHYGWPAEIDLFSAEFVDRFAGFARATARVIADHTDEIPYYAPVNEISFFSWAAGEVAYIYPFAHKNGSEVKRQLIRATLAAIHEIKSVDPRARIAAIDPIINVMARRKRPNRVAAERVNQSQFEAWDMIMGKREPGLGGHPRFLDIIGLNFYHDNQWEHFGERLRWNPEHPDARWMPLHKMLERMKHRYNRPLFIAETSHFGDGRAAWLREITREVALAAQAGVRLEGLCLYPILDRHDWENEKHWHHSGLIDVLQDAQGNLQRVVDKVYLAELRQSQNSLGNLDLR